MQKGKLIVIDGTDGSGKATQTKLLVDRLKKEKIKVATIDFPQYENNFFGSFIGHCLTERYYDFLKVHPKIASVLYAADRFESKKKIDDWINKGFIVICDRYVSSNKIHQGSKIKNNKKREEFLKWLDEMEHKAFEVPRPNAIVFLDVPVPVSRKLLQDKLAKDKKVYLKGKKDLVEKDIQYLNNSRKTSLWLSKIDKSFHRIACTDGRRMRSIDSIHEDVYLYIKKLIK
ncbi:MAG: dTMP kinase [Patescibacteria group bacterium]|nr:dTMP kinase [Patescibacteria group bacterium]